ncbi:related to NADPH2:quinone reductase [Pseudozyma flocculosa]|uniref:Probable quinone oxidoreductase n=1 Tax=Pseudozyma flocculosa TaxID=84751 RepID=A0A5C3F3Z3_9BASI|nr:related to NADPH2:quinone reductase [Pseudozyma flocculosa]
MTTLAVEIQRQGGPEVLEVREIPKPTPTPTQTYHYSGLYPLKCPVVIGQESAGVVEQVGEMVQKLKVGDRVVSYGAGSYAQHRVVDENIPVRIPDGIDTRMAAASYLQGLTALTLIREAYPVQKGDYVLVTAAAGGVGLLLCQMASAVGAHVIGTVSTEAKAELARANGAEHALIYHAERLDELVAQVDKITGGKGCQGIFDGVGKDTWEASFEMIARKGTIVTFGNASGAVPAFTPLKLAGKNVKVCRPTLFNYITTSEERETYSAELFDMIQSGKVKIHVHDEYPFTTEGIRKALADIKSRATTGKLIVKL